MVTELYKTEQARLRMFDSIDLKGTGVITFDEWLKFCLEHIIAKTATMDPHPILDHGNMEQSKEFLKILDIAYPQRLFTDDLEKRS